MEGWVGGLRGVLGGWAGVALGTSAGWGTRSCEPHILQKQEIPGDASNPIADPVIPLIVVIFPLRKAKFLNSIKESP